MLGEATMTGYPTGTARSRYADPDGPKSSIPCGDHPCHTIIIDLFFFDGMKYYENMNIFCSKLVGILSETVSFFYENHATENNYSSCVTP